MMCHLPQSMILNVLFTKLLLIIINAAYKSIRHSIWKQETGANFLHAIRFLIDISRSERYTNTIYILNILSIHQLLYQIKGLFDVELAAFAIHSLICINANAWLIELYPASMVSSYLIYKEERLTDQWSYVKLLPSSPLWIPNCVNPLAFGIPVPETPLSLRIPRYTYIHT